MVLLHKFCNLLGILFFVTSLSQLVSADSHYPKAVSKRLEGLDQGETNRCFSTAVATAYEHAFELNGFPVKLSLPYIQVAHTVHNVNPSSFLRYKLNLTPEDEALIHRHGYLAPHFMWPEDLKMVNDQYCKVDLANPTQMATIAADYKMEMESKQQEYTFRTGCSHSVDLRRIQRMLKDKRILTLPVVREVMHLFNHKTGLLPLEKFSEALSKVDEKADHMVALLGFDDELYHGQGGFIVKNTWDGDVKREIASESLTEMEAHDFQLFRGKICQQNLAGYYALPYSLVNETILLTNRDPNYEYGLLFSHPIPPYQEFHQLYKKYEPEYSVYSLPYSCNREKSLEVLYPFSKLVPLGYPLELFEEIQKTKRMILSHQLNRSKTAFFSVAQIAHESEIAQFYGNTEKYRQFYCPDGSIYPTLGQLQNLSFFQKLQKNEFNPKQEEDWSQFITELSAYEDDRLFIAPYSCDEASLSERVNYITSLARAVNRHSDSRLRTLAQRQLNLVFESFVKNPDNSGFDFAFLESKEEVIQFYSNDVKFRNKYCDGGEIFPSLNTVLGSQFLEKLMTNKYKEFKSKEYWIDLFNIFLPHQI